MKFEKLEGNKVKMEITVDAQAFEQGISIAYKKTASKYNLPGFRKGKAPRKMIEKAYGAEVFFMDAVDEVYWDAYVSASKEANIVPVDAPEVEIVQIGQDQDLIFSATVTVKPEVQVSAAQYKGIEMKRIAYNVTDEMVDAKIDTEVQKLVRWIEVERPIAQGDRVNLDYSGSVDGVLFEGGTATQETLDIGSNRFIPGFEEQMVGLSKGESADLAITFPEKYEPSLAGKEAVFHITVNEIKQKELPTIDDEFAKDVSEFDTLEQYKADVRANLVEQAKEREENALKNSAVEALIANVAVDIPDVMIARQVERTVEDMTMRMRYQGFSIEDYCSYSGITLEDMKKDIEPEAKARVHADLALEAVIRAEDFKPTQAQTDEEIARLAAQMKKTVEEINALIGPGQLEGIQYDLAVRMAVDMIIQNANIVDEVK